MFGYDDRRNASSSSFGPPVGSATPQPHLAAHFAKQAAQHALQQPNNLAAQQQAAAWAAGAAAAQAAAQGAPMPVPSGPAWPPGFPMPADAGYVGYEPPTPPHTAPGMTAPSHGSNEFWQNRKPLPLFGQ